MYRLKISIVFGFLATVCLFAQTGAAQDKDPKNQAAFSKTPVADLEAEAQTLENRWSGAARRRSVELYSELFELYRGSGEMQKAAFALRKSAHTSFLLEDYKSSLLKLKKSLTLEKPGADPAGRIKTLSLLALTYLQTGDAEASEKYLNEALKLSEAVDDASARAEVYYAAAELK